MKLPVKLKAAMGSLAIVVSLTQCVHEWPDEKPWRTVTLTVSHELGWDFHEHLVATRGAGDQKHVQRYQFHVYRKGDTEFPVAVNTISVQDPERAQFTVELEVPVGEHDIYVWTDNIPEQNLLRDHHYDTSEIGGVGYTWPYKGGDSQKEAYRGKTSVTVPGSIEAEIFIPCDVRLIKPLTSYAFVSTDVEKYVEAVATERRKKKTRSRTADDPAGDAADDTPDLSKYTVKVTYPYYHPTLYSCFSDKPTDAQTGVSYTTGIQTLDNGHALVCFDHFFINGSESSSHVVLDFYDEEGNRFAGTKGMDIPVKRGRVTVVKGEFLTARADGALGIDPGFDGEFNIEIF